MFFWFGYEILTYGSRQLDLGARLEDGLQHFLMPDINKGK
ncbi:hypothetical protein C943_04176 [Mariniradius saccharolyticus AK6]|uniref:Uncharacterized protein n=1 Tax=Mariniradius saccharolyticus AK6 TaxID=1239962 RepID=M7XZE8_9BACT|nr:hypothetical protein C943_04176 [Mariniradius saccharolyticus AK6]